MKTILISLITALSMCSSTFAQKGCDGCKASVTYGGYNQPLSGTTPFTWYLGPDEGPDDVLNHGECHPDIDHTGQPDCVGGRACNATAYFKIFILDHGVKVHDVTYKNGSGTWDPETNTGSVDLLASSCFSGSTTTVSFYGKIGSTIQGPIEVPITVYCSPCGFGGSSVFAGKHYGEEKALIRNYFPVNPAFEITNINLN